MPHRLLLKKGRANSGGNVVRTLVSGEGAGYSLPKAKRKRTFGVSEGGILSEIIRTSPGAWKRILEQQRQAYLPTK